MRHLSFKEMKDGVGENFDDTEMQHKIGEMVRTVKVKKVTQ